MYLKIKKKEKKQTPEILITTVFLCFFISFGDIYLEAWNKKLSVCSICCCPPISDKEVFVLLLVVQNCVDNVLFFTTKFSSLVRKILLRKKLKITVPCIIVLAS